MSSDFSTQFVFVELHDWKTASQWRLHGKLAVDAFFGYLSVVKYAKEKETSMLSSI